MGRIDKSVRKKSKRVSRQYAPPSRGWSRPPIPHVGPPTSKSTEGKEDRGRGSWQEGNLTSSSSVRRTRSRSGEPDGQGAPLRGWDGNGTWLWGSPPNLPKPPLTRGKTSDKSQWRGALQFLTNMPQNCQSHKIPREA